MKIRTLLTVLLGAFMMFSLFGCGTKSNLGNDVGDSTLESSEEEEVGASISESSMENGVDEPTSTVNPQSTPQPQDGENTDIYTKIYSQLDEANNSWLENFNTDQGEVAEIYLEKALLFHGKDDPIEGNKEISGYYKSNYQKISQIIEINVEARFGLSLVYEMGHFTTANNEQYQYFIAWRNENMTWLRELEMIEKIVANQTDPGEIDESRAAWVEFANARDSMALAEELYTSNAFYYYKSRLLQGVDEIGAEFSYMNNSGYIINLEPNIVKVVQSDLAYEIGKYSGSGNYSGLYIIRWEKESTGKWKISLDSN